MYRRHGKGVMRYASGNEYAGEWRADLRHGRGSMHWLDLGEIYVGEWRGGVQEGVGEHLWYPAGAAAPCDALAGGTATRAQAKQARGGGGAWAGQGTVRLGVRGCGVTFVMDPDPKGIRN